MSECQNEMNIKQMWVRKRFLMKVSITAKHDHSIVANDTQRYISIIVMPIGSHAMPSNHTLTKGTQQSNRVIVLSLSKSFLRFVLRFKCNSRVCVLLCVIYRQIFEYCYTSVWVQYLRCGKWYFASKLWNTIAKQIAILRIL